ncbi:hypothetical protein L1987_16202 [Smallanthus sonchifolius]|uniref:Uncharacterized protein n=1 Tax=Smallanthus sonchifolius TaxID=185202 RepID=A0ACB9J7Q4_9ASTR|nr:hypothetical protein L1987_16202 [Smallanthus sonchifolius]
MGFVRKKLHMLGIATKRNESMESIKTNFSGKTQSHSKMLWILRMPFKSISAIKPHVNQFLDHLSVLADFAMVVYFRTLSGIFSCLLTILSIIWP